MTYGVIDTCPNTLDVVSSQVFLTVINALMSAKCNLGPEGRYPADYGPNLKDGDEFDFIVVGAGSAGCVVANRLSEVAQWKVLLIEAGGYPSALTEIPSLSAYLQDTTEDWQYRTEPSTTCCLSLKNKQCRTPRGKALGGTSLFNSMLYTRSTRYDHERWFNAGNVGWDYDSVIGYYRRHENAHTDGDSDFGKEGELHLTRYISTDPVRHALSDAYQELGYGKYTEDKPMGFKDTLMTIYEGTRMSSSKAFLTPIKNRENLFLALNTQVSRLLVDANNLSVDGVQVKIANKTIKLKAKKEVVLSSGSVNTPSILMHSGIGPKDDLTELGITSVKNLPVGHNLQDHFAFSVIVSLDNSPPKTDLVNELYAFFMHKDGELSKTGIGNFLAYVSTFNETDKANVQYFHKVLPVNDPTSVQAFVDSRALSSRVLEQLLQVNKNSSLLIIIPTVLNPQSRGYIRLKSPDPFDKPMMISNYVSDEHHQDLQVVLDSIRIVQKLVKTNAFKEYNPKVVELDVPDCKGFAPDSDDFWKCLIRHTGSTVCHPVGTCKMGPEGDQEAVVNPRLQVIDVKGVRVVDGSVMPLHTSSNPNAPIIMIGEKGASFIKEDWLKEMS